MTGRGRGRRAGKTGSAPRGGPAHAPHGTARHAGTCNRAGRQVSRGDAAAPWIPDRGDAAGGSEGMTTSPLKIVLVDDQELVRAGVRKVLEGEPDMTVVGEAN